MKQVLAFVVTLIALLTLSCSPEGNIEYDPATAILLRDAAVFDVTSGTMEGPLDLIIEGDRIVALLPGGSERKAARVIDCSGKFVIPGLCDSHTHLAGLTTEDEADALQENLADFVGRGILFVRDVGGPVDVMREMKRKISSGELVGPEIFYTGPMLESSPLYWEKFNEDLPGFTVPVDNSGDVDALLPVLAENGATLVKTFNHINPELYPHIVSVARQNGLKIVHDPGIPLLNWVPIGEALAMGVTTFEHAFAPWAFVLEAQYQEQRASLSQPDVGMDQSMGFIAQMVDLGIDSISERRLQELSALMVKENAVLCPTLRAFQAREDDELAGDGDGEVDQEELDKRRMMQEMLVVCEHIVREMSENGVKLLVGHDGFDSVGVGEEMVLLYATGISPAEILRGATIYAAEWLEVEDRYGSVEPGKSADIVVLNSNPLKDIANVGDIYLVFQGGDIVVE